MPTHAEDAVASLRGLCQHLQAHEYALSTHTDDHAQQPNCGCGAADHLGAVLSLIDTAYDAIAQILSEWTFDTGLQRTTVNDSALNGTARDLPVLDASGIDASEIDRSVPDLSVPDRPVIERARLLSAVTSGMGQALNTAIRSIDENANSQVTGSHQEVIAVINSHPNTYVDRRALTAELAAGSLGLKKEPQAFVVDLWSLPAVASALGLEGLQRDSFISAAAAFNAAALLALSTPNMVVCTV